MTSAKSNTNTLWGPGQLCNRSPCPQEQIYFLPHHALAFLVPKGLAPRLVC